MCLCLSLPQESSSKQIMQLKSDLENTTSKLTAVTGDSNTYRISLQEEQSNSSSLRAEVAHLQEALQFERTATAELRVFLEEERSEKDAMLLRNAQISQDVEIVKQENRQQEIENLELQSRVETLENDLIGKVKEAEEATITLKELERKILELEEAERNKETLEGNERILKSSLLDLEEQLNDKNKVLTNNRLQYRTTENYRYYSKNKIFFIYDY